MQGFQYIGPDVGVEESVLSVKPFIYIEGGAGCCTKGTHVEKKTEGSPGKSCSGFS